MILVILFQVFPMYNKPYSARWNGIHPVNGWSQECSFFEAQQIGQTIFHRIFWIWFHPCDQWCSLHNSNEELSKPKIQKWQLFGKRTRALRTMSTNETTTVQISSTYSILSFICSHFPWYRDWALRKWYLALEAKILIRYWFPSKCWKHCWDKTSENKSKNTRSLAYFSQIYMNQGYCFDDNFLGIDIIHVAKVIWQHIRTYSNIFMWTSIIRANFSWICWILFRCCFGSFSWRFCSTSSIIESHKKSKCSQIAPIYRQQDMKYEVITVKLEL